MIGGGAIMEVNRVIIVFIDNNKCANIQRLSREQISSQKDALMSKLRNKWSRNDNNNNK